MSSKGGEMKMEDEKPPSFFFFGIGTFTTFTYIYLVCFSFHGTCISKWSKCQTLVDTEMLVPTSNPTIFRWFRFLFQSPSCLEQKRGFSKYLVGINFWNLPSTQDATTSPPGWCETFWIGNPYEPFFATIASWVGSRSKGKKIETNIFRAKGKQTRIL